jgi:hypothetical protein
MRGGHLVVHREESDRSGDERIAGAHVEHRLAAIVEVRPVVARLIVNAQLAASSFKDAVQARQKLCRDCDVALRRRADRERLGVPRQLEGEGCAVDRKHRHDVGALEPSSALLLG